MLFMIENCQQWEYQQGWLSDRTFVHVVEYDADIKIV